MNQSSPANKINFFWVAIGSAIIVSLNVALLAVFRDVLFAQMAENVGPGKAEVFAVIIIALGSFFVGGLVIGWLSPGETIKEPALAAIVAVTINIAKNAAWNPETFSVIQSAISMLIGFGFALAGAWVGERIQGDTTQKMRERGELPRTSDM